MYCRLELSPHGPIPMVNNDPLSEKVIAAAFAVGNELGHGFLEKVYLKATEIQACLLINFGGRKVEVRRLVNHFDE